MPSGTRSRAFWRLHAANRRLLRIQAGARLRPWRGWHGSSARFWSDPCSAQPSRQATHYATLSHASTWVLTRALVYRRLSSFGRSFNCRILDLTFHLSDSTLVLSDTDGGASPIPTSIVLICSGKNSINADMTGIIGTPSV